MTKELYKNVRDLNETEISCQRSNDVYYNKSCKGLIDICLHWHFGATSEDVKWQAVCTGHYESLFEVNDRRSHISGDSFAYFVILTRKLGSSIWNPRTSFHRQRDGVYFARVRVAMRFAPSSYGKLSGNEWAGWELWKYNGMTAALHGWSSETGTYMRSPWCTHILARCIYRQAISSLSCFITPHL